jgi:hypothetical protein
MRNDLAITIAVVVGVVGVVGDVFRDSARRTNLSTRLWQKTGMNSKDGLTKAGADTSVKLCNANMMQSKHPSARTDMIMSYTGVNFLGGLEADSTKLCNVGMLWIRPLQ